MLPIVTFLFYLSWPFFFLSLFIRFISWFLSFSLYFLISLFIYLFVYFFLFSDFALNPYLFVSSFFPLFSDFSLNPSLLFFLFLSIFRFRSNHLFVPFSPLHISDSALFLLFLYISFPFLSLFYSTSLSPPMSSPTPYFFTHTHTLLHLPSYSSSLHYSFIFPLNFLLPDYAASFPDYTRHCPVLSGSLDVKVEPSVAYQHALDSLHWAPFVSSFVNTRKVSVIYRWMLMMARSGWRWMRRGRWFSE